MQSRMLLTSTLRKSIVVFATLCGILVASERTQCGGVVSKTTGRRVDTYVCPGRKHSPLESRCCDPPEYECCRKATFFENHTTAIICSLLIAVFTLFTMLMVICLCWEKCILHKAIRRKPSLDYIARPDEVEHLKGISMPSEQSADTRIYEVNADRACRQSKDIA
uniref:Uncharacterized protein n=1 Tax=Parascaris univalens TaxID=6257 RepID=A0A914ZIE3_PARUN